MVILVEKMMKYQYITQLIGMQVYYICKEDKISWSETQGMQDQLLANMLGWG